MNCGLIDTGPLVAYLDRADPAHTEVAGVLDRFQGQLYTTGAVITEAMHFISTGRSGPALLSEFVSSSGMQVFDFAQPPTLRTAATLMEKYADTPMGYADATLVLLAEHLECFDILTLDRRGFSAYRATGNRAFHLILDHQ